MKKVSFVFALVILFTTWVSAHAQTGVTGTWQVLDVPGGLLPWTFVLKADGPILTGTATQGTATPIEICEGRIDGDALTFKVGCIKELYEREITLAGTLKGDEIRFIRSVAIRPGGRPGGNGLGGAGAGTVEVTAKRVTETEAAAAVAAAAERLTETEAAAAVAAAAKRVPGGDVPGLEFAVAVNFPEKDTKVEGRLFLPSAVSRARAVIVAISWGAGTLIYDDPEWRKLCETLGAGLLRVHFSTLTSPTIYTPGTFRGSAAASLEALLRRVAEESRHPELADVPLVFWGHSAAGGFVADLAVQLRPRAIAFVRYHSGGGDPTASSKIPALILKGGMDAVAGSDDLWKRARELGAPWTFALDPDAHHGFPREIKKANHVMLPWVTAITGQRLSTDGGSLRVVTDESGWIGNNQTGEVAMLTTFSGSRSEATWLPDETTSRGWQIATRRNADAGFKPIALDPQNPIVGAWNGTAHEESAGTDTYAVEVLLERVLVGQAAGRTFYPGLNCGGSIVLTQKTIDGAYVLSETIDSGRGCVGGRMVARLLPDDRIFLEWAAETDALPIAISILERKKISSAQ